MKPAVFDYRDPRTIGEALDLLAEARDDAAVLAGGQSLVPLLNMRLSRPEMVIDINRVPELDRIVISDDTVSVGATVRLSTVEHDSGIAGALPVLGRAASWVAHPQIRNRTTMGGTLCHADPAAEIPTVAVALDARLQLRSRSASRSIAAEEFFQSVFTTTKEPEELLVSVDFPRPQGMIVGYDEVARRHGDFPFVGLCLGVRLADGVVTEARAAAAGVADRPIRLSGMEQTLTGRALSEAAADAADAAAAEVDPTQDLHATTEYRRGLLRTLVRRLVNEFEEQSA